MTKLCGSSSSGRRFVATLAALSALFVSLACSGPSDKGLFAITPPPGPPAFNVVSDALDIHCGTLNCHGNNDRNMRIFGFYGTRLSDKDKTGAAATSEDEYQANFESIISIEPERLSQIVRSGGANEGKWVVLSKGRGTEHHKGGSRMTPGDAMDTCFTSWIVAHGPGPGDGGAIPGAVNDAACLAAVREIVPPGQDWASQ